ncbi:hypothetical protein [Edaphobacter flagellatus]|uniref:hypothetical protein n=1 Tax=Edaphobacter flagellatus TaxID=1933044 RepID=UPI0021B36A82|nr:hypothetical protein [Edaphobacter flagellatus]
MMEAKGPYRKMTPTPLETCSLQRWHAEAWLRRLWPVYCLLVILAAFGYARFDPYQIDGDAVSYMDIGDLIRSHQWAGIVNGYWHPLYPAALALGHSLFHSTRYTELPAYYMVNFAIFLLEMIAVVAFTDAIIRLRDSRATLAGDTPSSPFLLGRYPLRYLGLALLVIASQRELSIGKVRPDALLQALLLFGFAALLTNLATGRLHYVALMGASFGLAFLTKSFAFPVTLISVALLALFSWLWQRQSLGRVFIKAAIGLTCFALVAGPYIAALSKQKHRLDFGDSGSLNYAWYVAGTEKMHLQNGTPQLYGTSDVHLLHPEKVIYTSPLVVSYKEFPYGTYPAWFDATYWNDSIKPHMNIKGQLRTWAREAVLIVRYLLNHPEGWLLFGLLLLLGARPDLCRRLAGNGFWVIPLLLGIAIFAIYGMVNVEERYVTVGYLAILLTLFASLRSTREAAAISVSSALILLLAFLSLGESVRRVAELRRDESSSGLPASWYDPEIFQAARAINQLGVGPGDTVACAGVHACLHTHYWARLAGVRIQSEIDFPTPHLYAPRTAPHMKEAIEAAQRDGARILVGYFDPVQMRETDPATAGWVSLGDTDFYALLLNPAPAAVPMEKATLPKP